MEHVTIVQIGDNNVKMIPEQGYKLADKFGNVYSEVVCKDVGDFIAIPE